MNKKTNPVNEAVKKSLRKNPGTVIFTFFCILASVITALLPPLVLEKGVNMISESQNIPFSLALLYLGMIVLSDLFEAAQGAAIMILGQKLTHGLRSALCEKLNRLGAGFFASKDSGLIASVFVNDADAIDALYSDGIVGMVADSFKIISILIIIFTKSLGLGIILLGITPLLFLMTRVFQRNTLLAQSDNRLAIAKVNNHIPETIKNIRMIHVFQKEKYMEEKYDDSIKESYNAVNRSNFYDSIYSPIILVTESLVIAIMMIGAANGTSAREFFGLSVGSAVAVIAYVGKIFSPLESIGMEIQNIQSAVAGIKNINQFLSEEEMPEFCKLPVDDSVKMNIEFNNVTFWYKEDSPVLKDFSFDVKQGDQVTFMGRTGAGKSTIFRLLTGLYSPKSGHIRIANTSPAKLADSEKRRIFGIVEQKFNVVPGSIRDQITLYDSSITDEMVNETLKTVGLKDTVNAMEAGLDTPMKEGLFSHGQLQLLAIARATVTSPSILLLDEITANLDSETEAKVLTALKEASKERTVLSISHRFSDIMKDERIIQVGAK